MPRTGRSRYWAKTFPEAFHKSQIWAFQKTFYPIPWLTVFNTPPSFIARKKAQVMTDYAGMHQKKSRIESEE